MKFFQSGTIQWWAQRSTTLIIAAYIVSLLALSLVIPNDASAWESLLFSPTMRVLGTLGLLALILHAWIGIWIVVTDYVPLCVRSWVLRGFIALSAIESIWVIGLFWG